MKLFFVACCVLLVIGCEATPAPVSADVDLSASAILARQTSDAAGARSAALSAQATAARQSTADTQNRIATDAAIELNFLRVTAEAQQRLVEGSNLQKTEVARFAANATADARTVIAQQKTDAETATWRTRTAAETAAAQTSTASVVQTGTRKAEQHETATATAAVPTKIALAQLAENNRAAGERARMLELERYRKEMELAPYVRAFELFMPYCVTGLFFLGVMLLLWRVGEGVKNWLDGKTLQAGVKASSDIKLITDAYGNPLGYLEPAGGTVRFTPIKFPEPDYDETPVPPALLVRGGPDPRPALPPPQEVAPQPEPVVRNLIHLSALRTFTETILATGDWTQSTWSGKTLPRGYVLSMDTLDAQGNTVPGGYSQLLQMFVDSHLIILRRAKATGKWNPLAPTDIEGVMAVLENRSPLPPLPPDPTPPTYPAKRKSRKTMPSVQVSSD